MTPNTNIVVTSHVGRDLLDSAAAFKTEASVVWEYVVNSLQYVDRGTHPKVRVQVNSAKKEIVIGDNGRGLSASDLQNFFIMHGENRDRLAGHSGRGKFGTGKSAAFGIATTLRVDTVKNGLRNVVTLTREMIEKSSGENIPLQWDVKDETVSAPNGTNITIGDVILPRIRTAPIIDYIERHLQVFRAALPEVAVNSHVCAYREPEIEATHAFKPSPAQAEAIGDLELTVRVARGPLPEAEQGISVTAGLGNLVAVERGGIEAKEFGSYIFGEVDVPAIEKSDSKMAPYDSSRSLQLNPAHPVVAVLVGFIGSKLERVRSELVRRAKDARKVEEGRRLAVEAERIAEILNEDFRTVRDRLRQIRSASSRSGAADANFGDSTGTADDIDDWVKGTQEPGNVETGGSGNQGTGESGKEAPNVTPRGERNPEGSSSVDPAGGTGTKRERPRGGFRVDYRHLGKQAERSLYDSAALTILINLDHPVVAAALGDGKVEDAAFRRLSYEIAFSEYSMGLGYEVFKQDPNIPADDLLYEVRSTLNRIAKSAASLYR